jgi:hypothetical protein
MVRLLRPPRLLQGLRGDAIRVEGLAPSSAARTTQALRIARIPGNVAALVPLSPEFPEAAIEGRRPPLQGPDALDESRSRLHARRMANPPDQRRVAGRGQWPGHPGLTPSHPCRRASPRPFHDVPRVEFRGARRNPPRKALMRPARHAPKADVAKRVSTTNMCSGSDIAGQGSPPAGGYGTWARSGPRSAGHRHTW